MGISMLGSWLGDLISGLFSSLFSVLGDLLTKILEFILVPIINLAVSLIEYAVGMIFYSISTFLLGLIDYVEILFRLLAGLETDSGAKLNLGSSPDKSSDLLVQLLRSNEIRDIFLSMCVVGLFLLVITTIFQMIKVEYTTEGAKNSKTPILNKAFKGLCNMVMVPGLCIFGVFIGNQVLDLLDKATKPDADGSAATISGTLFVTAASEAYWREGEWQIKLSSTSMTSALVEVAVNIFPMIFNSFTDTSNNDFVLKDTDRERIEAEFMSGDLKYSNIGKVTEYYNYSKINYLLLIFGSCFVIKCLYYTCFGMIVRLYQCGMLFIISPAVIGMTPVNEGGLGKWRSEFVGQAISAYGVVLAVNIFLVLVRVLLSIDMNFSVLGTDNLSTFSSSMMTGLLKGIIVIGGCITIEKFSGQLGGFFGAKDALSQGKDLEKGVKDQAKKAVGTAAQVGMMATGVGGAAMGAMRGMGKGIASGVKGAYKFGHNVRNEGFGHAVGETALGQAGKKVGEGVSKGWSATKNAVTHPGQTIKGAASKFVENNETINDFMKFRADLQLESAQKRHDLAESGEAEAKKASREARNAGGKDSRFKATLLTNKAATFRKEKEAAAADVSKYTEQADKYGKRAGELSEKRAKDDVVKNSKRIASRERGIQAGRSFFDNSFLGQTFSSVKKQASGYDDAAKKAGGKEVTAAYEHLAKISSDAKEEKANARNKTFISEKNQAQVLEVKKMAIDEVHTTNKTRASSYNAALTNARFYNNKLNEVDASGTSLVDRMNNGTASAKDQSDYESYSQALNQTVKSIADTFGTGVKNVETDVKANVEITGSALEHIQINPEKLETAFKEIIKKGGFDAKDIADVVKKTFTGESKVLVKEITDCIEKALSKHAK